MPDQPLVSIIVPVLNEADCLEQTLTRLLNRRWVDQHCEVIVSDGGSHDGSLEIVRRHHCKLVHSESGRARQMNTASLEARGRILLFLHADSELAENFGDEVADSDGWGFFCLRLSGEGIAYRVIETAINLRTRISKVAGGDQALFFDRRLFEALGRFPDIPLMEDIAISKKARKRAAPRIIQHAITSSSRRWREHGIIKTVLLMWSLRLAFWLGVDPVRLHRIYYPQRG